MSNPFPELRPFDVAQPRQIQPRAMDGESWLAEEMRKERDRQVRDTILTAPSADQVARGTRIAREAGVPPLMVDGRLDEAEKGLNADRFAKVADAHPAIGKWAANNPRGVAAAQDDSESLGLLGRAWDTIKKAPARVGGVGSYRFLGGVTDTWNMIQELQDTALTPFYSGMSALAQASGIQALDPQAYLEDEARRRKQSSAYFDRKINEFAQRNRGAGFVEESVLGGLDTMVTSIVAMVTRNPGTAAAVMGAMSGAPAYRQAREHGKGVGDALRYGFEQGAIEALTERMPAGAWLEAITKRTPFGQTVLRQLQQEIPGEQVATVLQDFSEWVNLNPDKPFSAYLAERPQAALATALATISGTSAQVGAVHVTTRAVDATAKVADRVVASRVAKDNRRFFDLAGKAAEGSKLRPRDPEAYNDAIRAEAEENGLTEAYIPGEAVQAYMQSDSYDPDSDPLRDFLPEIEEAIATGGDVVLPIEFATGTLPGTAAWQALKDDMRLTPGGMSVREAQTFDDAMADIMADLADQTARQDQENAANRTAFEKLADSITQKLQNAGFTPVVSRQQAELFAQRALTRATRLGQEITGNEFDQTEVRNVLPPALAEARKADATDLVINALRRGKDPTIKSGPSLIEWIAKNGGIWDGDVDGAFKGGDLKAMGLGEWHKGKPGKRKAIRDPKLGHGGRGADAILVDAIEAGYFPELQGYDEAADAQVLLDAINDELSGNPRYTADTRIDAMRAAAQELDDLLVQRGLDPAGMSDQELRDVIAQMDEAGLTEGQAFDQRTAISDDIDAAWDGRRTRGRISLGDSPTVLKRFGFKGEISIDRGKINKIANKHDLSRDTLYKLPQLLASPWAVFPSTDENKPDAVVVALKTRDRAGDPVIAIVDRDGGVAFVSSVYGKSGKGAASGDDWIIRQINEAKASGKRVYEDGAPPERDPEPISGIIPARPRKPILSLRTKDKNSLEQSFDDGPRGRISFPAAGFGTGPTIIELFQSRNLSTMLHETGHQWLEELRFDAALDEAPDQLKADWQAVQDWFADSGHPVADGVIPVEAHEMWARGVERYLMAGKAPSSALTRLFETFRGWLVSIYKTVDRLKAPITPEIREVMDRLIATDEEIAAAAEAQAMAPLFKDAADLMTGPEFQAYRTQFETSRGEANRKLLEKTMAAIRRRETARYREARKGIEAEITEMVDGRPLFRAIRLLKAEPISRQWIVDEFGEDALALLPKRVPPIYRDNGAHPTIVAELSGYASGHEMIEAMIGAEIAHRESVESGDKRTMRERTIETETDAEMARRHGDPLNDGSIEREALAAVHNEMAGEVIASEIRILARKSGNRPTPYRIARDWARNRVRQGTYANEASPAAIQRHARAVAKAGRAAEQAMLKGDVEETLRFKQQQMLSSALLAEAKAANDEVESARKRLDKIARQQTSKSIDQDYLEQAHALLEQVDLKERTQKSLSRQASWAEWAAQREAEGYDVVVPPSFAETLGQTNWTRLPVETLLGLDEAVKQVIHLGRLKQTLLDNQERREFDAVVQEAVDGAGNIKGPPPQGLEDPSWWGAIKSRVAGGDAALLKLETIFDWLDGGNSNGVFNRIAFRPIAEAQAREQDMLKDYYGRIRALFEAVPAKTAQRWTDKVSLPFIDPFTGKPASFQRQKLIAMALNVGNEGNLQRLADGYGWNAGAITDYLSSELTADEWRFVQGVWDTIETLWPEIEALERRVNGVAPEKVEPTAIVTPYGTFRGGYYPAIYDSRLDRKAKGNQQEAENRLFEPNAVRATTRASSTQARAEKVTRPIALDLGVLNRHLGEVIHDITHREAVMQAWKFLSSQRVQKAVDEALGNQYTDTFRPWVKFVANSWAMERAGNEAFGAWIGKLRANATAVGLGLRATTMVTQLAGYANSTEIIGERWMAEGLTRFSAHPVQSFRFVMDRSGEVRHRMDTLDRDLRTEIARIAATNPISKGYSRVQDAKVFMFHGIGLMDRAVVIPTWIGAYNKGLSEGMSEAEAAYAADKTVRISQGAGAPKDLAAIQRGTGKWGEALKLMTMFYSYFSAMYQRERTLARDIAGDDARRPRTVPRLAARAFWLLIVPPLLVELMKVPLGAGGPDDDEWWAQWVMRKMISNALGPIPLARDVFEPAWQGAIGGHAFNPQISPINRALSSLVDVAKDAGKIARGEETTKATKHALEAAGYVTGLVPGQVASATQFLVDVGSGDADPEGFSDWIEGLATGRVKED